MANSRCPQRDSPLWALALALMNIHENISGVMAAGGLFTPAKNQREGAAVSDGGKNVEVGGQNVMEMRVWAPVCISGSGRLGRFVKDMLRGCCRGDSSHMD